MTSDLNERALLGAATAALNARRAANGWPPTSLDKMMTSDREAWIEDVRAAITAYQAEAWQDIGAAPTLKRVFVAGWQPRSGNVQGYWWLYEDVTDENGRAIDHPTATKWQPLPPAPKASP